MKKLLSLLICLSLFSCSNDEEEEDREEMCCGTPVAELIESYHVMYKEMLENENLTTQGRIDLQNEYDYALEEPCKFHIERVLEPAGASCDNPN